MMSDALAVQRPMLQHAEAIGWKYINQETALQKRSGEAGIFLFDGLEVR